MHVEAWLDRLARADGEPRDRLVAALETLAPDAATVFTPLPDEPALVEAGDPGARRCASSRPLAGRRSRRPSRASTCRCRAADPAPARWPERPRRRVPLAVGRVHVGPPRGPGSDLVSERGTQVGVARRRAGASSATRRRPAIDRSASMSRPCRAAPRRGHRPGAADGLDRRPRHDRARSTVGPDPIRVELLPTFVGCPALELIRASVAERLAAFGRPVEVVTSFEVPWTSDRISAGGPRRPLAAAGIAPPTEPAAARCPYCGVAPGRPGQPLRPDPVPVALLLPRLPPAVRSDQAGLTVGAGRSGPSASSGPARWAPGSPSSPSRPATTSGSTTSTRRPSSAAAGRIRDGLARRAARLGPRRGRDRRLGRRPPRAPPPAVDRSTASPAADLVIEAAVEDLDVKRSIFAALDARRAADADPRHEHERAVGRGHRRGDGAARAASSACTSSTRRRSCASSRSSRAGDRPGGRRRRRSRSWTAGARPRSAARIRPGFIVNRVNRPFTIEALRVARGG